MQNRFGHTWCNCLECDQRVDALRTLVVVRGNRDDDLMIAFVHHTHTNSASGSAYHVFGETYYLLTHFGEIQDPQLVDPDEDDDDDEEWEPEDGN